MTEFVWVIIYNLRIVNIALASSQTFNEQVFVSISFACIILAALCSFLQQPKNYLSVTLARFIYDCIEITLIMLVCTTVCQPLFIVFSLIDMQFASIYATYNIKRARLQQLILGEEQALVPDK